MFSIVKSGIFKKNLRKLAKSDRSILYDLEKVLTELRNGGGVSQKYCKHKLDGTMKGMFSVHIRPDCILVYSKDSKNNSINLRNAGSHANIMENRKWVSWN